MGKKILLLFMMVWLSVSVNAHKGSCDATWLGESKTCPPDLFENSNSHKGVTIGNFININDRGSLPVDEHGKFAPQNDPLYMHEYGHYLQSQKYGWEYLISVGIPSLFSASTADRLDTPPFSTHNEKWFEKSANKMASEYFGNKYGVNWNTRYVPWFWPEWKKTQFWYLRYKDFYPI